MITHVQNGMVVTMPGPAPETWKDPATGISESCFRNWTWERMQAAGWKEAVDAPLSFDPLYEQLAVGEWYHDAGTDTVTRDYTISDRPLEIVRTDRLAAVRAECSSKIIAVIPLIQQLNIANGIDPDLGYITWIADMREASNRCEDLYSAAVDMAGLKAVAWNFPAYVAP